MKTVYIVFVSEQKAAAFGEKLGDKLSKGEDYGIGTFDNRKGELRYLMGITLHESHLAKILEFVADNTSVHFFDIDGEEKGIKIGSDKYYNILERYAHA